LLVSLISTSQNIVSRFYYDIRDKTAYASSLEAGSLIKELPFLLRKIDKRRFLRWA